MTKGFIRLFALLITLALIVGMLGSCDILESSFELLFGETEKEPTDMTISGGEIITLRFGESVQLTVEADGELTEDVAWSSSSACVHISDGGVAAATATGDAIVTATYGELSDTIVIVVESGDNSDADGGGDINGGGTGSGDGTGGDTVIPDDKYENMSREEFYADYKPAESYVDALLRSAEGFMSGDITVPDAEPTIPAYMPKSGDKYVRNSSTYFSDGGYTYTVVDGYGNEVLKVYKGGGYITLEEVAAYVYAFGDIPANYDSNKNAKTVANSAKSVWGEYLRLNNSRFSGSTSKYPYEPELPNISGCGGSFEYYEIDIGTTGTDTGTSHAVAPYNNGTKITRGAARIVYARADGGRIITDPNERYVFYTYNHYNDFQEYLNYFGGWGEIFGNITGGGTLSSKYDYNPTPYAEVERSDFSTVVIEYVVVIPFYYKENEIIA